MRHKNYWDAGGTYTELAGCGVLEVFLVVLGCAPSRSGMYSGPLRPQPASMPMQARLPINLKKYGVGRKPEWDFTIKITV
jgi:hypothetical protein